MAKVMYQQKPEDCIEFLTDAILQNAITEAEAEKILKSINGTTHDEIPRSGAGHSF